MVGFGLTNLQMQKGFVGQSSTKAQVQQAFPAIKTKAMKAGQYAKDKGSILTTHFMALDYIISEIQWTQHFLDA